MAVIDFHNHFYRSIFRLAGIKFLKLSAADEAKILSGNARALLAG